MLTQHNKAKLMPSNYSIKFPHCQASVEADYPTKYCVQLFPQVFSHIILRQSNVIHIRHLFHLCNLNVWPQQCNMLTFGALHHLHNWQYEIFAMWNFCNVKYSQCEIFTKWNIHLRFYLVTASSGVRPACPPPMTCQFEATKPQLFHWWNTLQGCVWIV